MELEHRTHPAQAEEGASLVESNRRLQALVSELLKKNEALRQQLALLQQPAGEPAVRPQAS